MRAAAEREQDFVAGLPSCVDLPARQERNRRVARERALDQALSSRVLLGRSRWRLLSFWSIGASSTPSVGAISFARLLPELLVVEQGLHRDARRRLHVADGADHGADRDDGALLAVEVAVGGRRAASASGFSRAESRGLRSP